jgi:hypothetical protein
MDPLSPNPIRSLHVTVHRLSTSTPAGGDAGACGQLSPLSISFDELAEQLAAQADLFFEPDGSFVWRTPEGQLDGQLYDGPAALQYVELRGKCTRVMWEQMVRWLSVPGDRLAVQHVETGRVMPEIDFREW